ncbi:hypothetical protein D3C71_1629500 [compost metagenome]
MYDIDLYLFFKYLNDHKLPSINDPLGISGRISACSTDAKYATALAKVKGDYIRAEEAYNNREKNLDKCFERWNIFFNSEFPNR